MRSLALKVAEQLTSNDAIAADAREELGISEVTTASPLQAVLTSAVTFALGAALPLGVALAAPFNCLTATVPLFSLVFLAGLGAMGPKAGGAPVAKAVFRVAFRGAIAMATTAGVGRLVGAVV